jgi:hypothetical protein
MGHALARFATPMAAGEGPRCSTRRRRPWLPVPQLGHAGRHRPAPRPLLPARLTGQPGSRAPHLQVTVDHRPISTLDLYGRSQPQVPVAAYRFGVELTPADGAAAHRIGSGERCWSGPTASSPGAASAPPPTPPPSSGASSVDVLSAPG